MTERWKWRWETGAGKDTRAKDTTALRSDQAAERKQWGLEARLGEQRFKINQNKMDSRM